MGDEVRPLSLSKKRPPDVSPYAYSKKVLETFLAMRDRLGAKATLEDAARALGADSSAYAQARQHCEAVESLNLSEWVPRNMAIEKLRQERPLQEAQVANEARNLLRSVVQSVCDSASTLPEFDPAVVADYLNRQARRQRFATKQAARKLTGWLVTLDNHIHN